MAHEQGAIREAIDDGIAVWVRRRLVILSSALAAGFDLAGIVTRARQSTARFEVGPAEQAAEIKAFRMGLDGEVAPAMIELMRAGASTVEAPGVSIEDRQTSNAAIARLAKATFLDPADPADRSAYDVLVEAFVGQWPWLGGVDPWDET